MALRVNGETHRLQIDPRATVLNTLRETLHLTGTKKGCDHGQCGACTVHVNGRRVNNVNPLCARGVGEIGMAGLASAVANATYHATGIRVRDLPIRIEDLLGTPSHLGNA